MIIGNFTTTEPGTPTRASSRPSRLQSARWCSAERGAGRQGAKPSRRESRQDRLCRARCRVEEAQRGEPGLPLGPALSQPLNCALLWAPQRPLPDQTGLLGHIEEIVRRGRVRGFIPWLITQRPAVVHKDVLSQADILIAMKLTASQDRDAIGGWIEGQADRQEGKRILGDLPRLQRGEGYLWAPGRGILDRVAFPAIRTFDSSRTPKRGESLATPRTLAEVDLTAITAALAAAETPEAGKEDRRRHARFERELAAAKARIEVLERENRDLASRLAEIAALAGSKNATAVSVPELSLTREAKPPRPVRAVSADAAAFQ
jgi:hypothetical protein